MWPDQPQVSNTHNWKNIWSCGNLYLDVKSAKCDSQLKETNVPQGKCKVDAWGY